MASLLEDIRAVAQSVGATCTTAYIAGKAPATYWLLTPVIDEYSAGGDNAPLDEVQTVRVTLCTKGNYYQLKRVMEEMFLSAGMTITERRFLEHDESTGYYTYAIELAKSYDIMEV